VTPWGAQVDPWMPVTDDMIEVDPWVPITDDMIEVVWHA